MNVETIRRSKEHFTVSATAVFRRFDLERGEALGQRSNRFICCQNALAFGNQCSCRLLQFVVCSYRCLLQHLYAVLTTICLKPTKSIIRRFA